MSKKMKVIYKGRKPKMPVNFPIGCKSQGAYTDTIFLQPNKPVEMEEEDAHKLVALDSHNFAFADGKTESKLTKEEVIAENSESPDGEPVQGKGKIDKNTEFYDPEPKKKKAAVKKAKK